MNNISCEHCGAGINLDSDKKCPNCGAPYKNNKQYKEYLEYEKKKRELNLETHQIVNDLTKGIDNTQKKVVPAIIAIVLIIILFVAATIVIIITNASSSKNNSTNSYTNIQNQTNNSYGEDLINEMINKKDEMLDNSNKETISVSFNENAKTDEFDIKVDKIIKYNETTYKTKNKLYYGFHIVFNNKTERWKTLNNIKITYTDSKGIEQFKYRSLVSAKQLDLFTTEIKKYDGYLYFQIPEDVKDVTINFENVKIIIKNYKGKI